MDTPVSTQIYRTRRQELQALRHHWVWFLALGIGMAVIGTIAVGFACIATVTVAATYLFGFLMIGGGIAEVISSFSAGRWSGTLIHLLIGVLYIVAGLLVIDQPLESAVTLTLLIALFLMISGIFRVVYALSERFTGWGWVLLNGVITLLMGLLIYKQWPTSGLWVIGLFVGIDMILNGWGWIMLAIGLRNAPAAESVA